MAGTPDLFEVASDAIRWCVAAARPVDGGLTWPNVLNAAPRPDDAIYSGTAGVLLALAEAKLTGLEGVDEPATAAVGRLASLIRAARSGDREPPNFALYTGFTGYGEALGAWSAAAAAGDGASCELARDSLALVAARAAAGRVCEYFDLLLGEAGVLVALARLRPRASADAISALVARLLEGAEQTAGGRRWRSGPHFPREMPNFSHGAAGIAYALLRAAATLGRDDLVVVAASAGRRLVALGESAIGTIAVPGLAAARGQPPSFGFCHGPTGTLRLFEELDVAQPGYGWGAYADECRAAIRTSGLPERIFPGFWDNLGQCCGTAGVGEMALDHYQQTGDAQWLEWCDELAADVLARRVTDATGTRWSNTEHKAEPPTLPPRVGWMQGTAGIAGWLCRLARVQRDGRTAARLARSDKPALAVDLPLPAALDN